MFHEPVYTIGHAAKKLGVAVPTLRMYEHAGLIIPHRTPSNRRLYSRHDIEYLEVILDLIRNQGLNIEAIKRMLALIPCWRIIDCPKETREKCPAYTDSNVPCWLMHKNPCGKYKEECSSCDVYLSCPKMLRDPKQIVRSWGETDKSNN